MKNNQFGWNNLPDPIKSYITEITKELPYSDKVCQKIRGKIALWFSRRLNTMNDDQAGPLLEKFQRTERDRMIKKFHRKYGQSLWWKWTKRVSAVLLIWILLVAAFIWWFLSGEPVIRIDYAEKMNTLISEGVAPEDDALPYYLKAIELYTEPNSTDNDLINMARRFGDFESGFNELSPAEQKKVHTFIKNNEKFWQAITPKNKKQVLDELADGHVMLWPGNDDQTGSPSKGMMMPGGMMGGMGMPGMEYSMMRDTPYGRGGELSTAVEDVLNVIRADTDILDTATFGASDDSSGMSMSTSPWPDEKTDSNAIENDPSQTQKRQWALGISVPLIHEWITQSQQSILENEFYGPPIKRHLKQNEKAWAIFVQAAQKPECCWQYEYNDEYTELPMLMNRIFLGNFFRFSRQGKNRIMLQREAGSIPGAIQISLNMIRAGKHLCNEKLPIIDQLIGNGIIYSGMNELQDIVMNESLPKDKLQGLQDGLRLIFNEGYPVLGFAGERMFLDDNIQRVYTEGWLGGGHVIPFQLKRLPISILHDEDKWELYCEVFKSPFRDKLVAQADDTFDKITKASHSKPFIYAKDKGLGSFDILSQSYEVFDVDGLAYYMTLKISHNRKAKYEALMTIVNLQKWKLENGTYPASLEELLKAGTLKKLPDDPFGEATLTYQRKGDNFILYSWGEDYDDDGGKIIQKNEDGEIKNGDWIIWPVDESERKSNGRIY